MRPAMTDDELMHFGIKGMHWGVRRYQNPDGSLTSAGESRYGKKPGFLTKRKNKKKMAKVRAAKEAKNNRDYEEPSSKTKNLSDKDLNNRIDRLKKEKEYKQLMEDVRKPGKKFVMNILQKAGSTVLTNAATKVGEHYVNQFLKKRGIGVNPQDKINKDMSKISLEMKKIQLEKMRKELGK